MLAKEHKIKTRFAQGSGLPTKYLDSEVQQKQHNRTLEQFRDKVIFFFFFSSKRCGVGQGRGYRIPQEMCSRVGGGQRSEPLDLA